MSITLGSVHHQSLAEPSALDVDAGEAGVPGELVCRQAFPIEPLGFWPLQGYDFPEQDVRNAQERFLDSYFKDDKGTWCEYGTGVLDRGIMLTISPRRLVGPFQYASNVDD